MKAYAEQSRETGRTGGIRGREIGAFKSASELWGRLCIARTPGLLSHDPPRSLMGGDGNSRFPPINE